MDEIPMPWKVRSRQQVGLATEKEIARKRGTRLHPRSGAGPIKDDSSNEHYLLEIKDANVTHTIKGDDLEAVFRRAAAQGKVGQYIIYFQKANVTLTGTITKGKG